MRVLFGRFASLLLPLLAVTGAAANTLSGQVDWPPWKFTWAVDEGGQADGVALKSLTYNGVLILERASMPVVRVKYEPGAPKLECGPFSDQFTSERIQDWPFSGGCDSEPPCIRDFVDGNGRAWLEVAVYAEIGAYRLVQTWFLSVDGYVTAVMASSGLECEYSHDHHPHWRLDFDLSDPYWNEISLHGPDAHVYTHEELHKKTALNHYWRIRDLKRGHKVELFPGPNDGVPTATTFAPASAAVLVYETAEQSWNVNQDLHSGLTNFLETGAWLTDPPESLLGGPGNAPRKDVVFWYIAHLHHEVDDGEDEWHKVGPLMKVTVNEAPTVVITEPKDGAAVPFGAPIPFAATASDKEDGADCCTIRWWTVPGNVAMVGKKVILPIGPGTTKIFARAYDSGGRESELASIVVHASNEKPKAKILAPTPGQHVEELSPLTLRGTCSDLNEFGGLPPSAATWEVFPPLPGKLGTGYQQVIQIPGPAPGIRTIRLTCTDPQNATDQANVNIYIDPAAASSPPTVAIASPHLNALLEPNVPTTLVAVTGGPGPVTLTWAILTGGKKAKIIGTGNNLVWTPSNDVIPSPGGANVRIRVQAQNSFGKKSALVDFVVYFPPA